MRFPKNLLPVLILAGGTLFTSCRDQRYEIVPSNRIFGCWGVSNDTKSFGQYDSLFYLINPVRNIQDSIYYNGNYTDSYYDADSTRVTLRYTTGDSIDFYIERMYSVEVNPKYLILYAKESPDSAASVCSLLLARDHSDGNRFRCGPDKNFTTLLAKDTLIYFTGTNASQSGEPQGGQNYEFVIDGRGFQTAVAMADTLNLKRNSVAHRAAHSDLHHNIFDEIFHIQQNKKSTETIESKPAQASKKTDDEAATEVKGLKTKQDRKKHRINKHK